MIVLHVLCVCKCSPAGHIMGAGAKLKQVLSIHMKTMETRVKISSLSFSPFFFKIKISDNDKLFF